MNEHAGKGLRRAERSIEAARRELAAGAPDFAANHAYYAMFYTADALLFTRNLTFSSHGAVHGAFGKEFAKTGDLDPQFHRWLLAAFRERQDATYELEPEITNDQAIILIDRAEEFLVAVRELRGSGWLSGPQRAPARGRWPIRPDTTRTGRWMVLSPSLASRNIANVVKGGVYDP